MKNAEGRELDGLYEEIYDEGTEKLPYCGMVRAILEQNTDLKWRDLEARLGR